MSDEKTITANVNVKAGAEEVINVADAQQIVALSKRYRAKKAGLEATVEEIKELQKEKKEALEAMAKIADEISTLAIESKPDQQIPLFDGDADEEALTADDQPEEAVSQGDEDDEPDFVACEACGVVIEEGESVFESDDGATLCAACYDELPVHGGEEDQSDDEDDDADPWAAEDEA